MLEHNKQGLGGANASHAVMPLDLGQRGRRVEDRRSGIYSKNSLSCGELRLPGVQSEAGVCQELLAGTAYKVLECDLNSGVTRMRVIG